jgi:hypothetical protein
VVLAGTGQHVIRAADLDFFVRRTRAVELSEPALLDLGASAL